MKVLMLFLDGVGIGPDDPEVNPFLRAHLPALRSVFGGEVPTLRRPHLGNGAATLVPLDATLGVEGLPQSGTGQTALFTGVNAPQLIGKHFGPYPYSTLRPIIAEKNIFRVLMNDGQTVYFANAYPQKFFDYFRDRQTRLTVTTLSCHYAEMPLHTFEDLHSGRAVSADITNAGWPRMGYAIEPIAPEEAGKRLVRLTREYDFVLFEYWRTDKAGHSENIAEAIAALEVLDAMLHGVLETLPTDDTLLIITSDHGNIEDMSTKVHTRNPVPAILYGRHHRTVAEALMQVPDLTSVTPTVRHVLNETITALI
jgi:2,3-bisphosphoglycerate-independent phosphoglycerate mutase